MAHIYKQINAVWFSPTGTTKRVVVEIGESVKRYLGCGSVMKRSFTLPEERRLPLIFDTSDLVIIGVPVYAGRVPNILLEYLKTMEGRGATAIPIVLYGNRDYDDALIELYDIMGERGFQVIAAGAFIGEHSFSRILAKGRPDRDDMEVIDTFALKISQKIQRGDLRSGISIPGRRPYRPYYRPVDTQGEFFDFRKIKPKTGKGCSTCRLCIDICPMGSIGPEDIHDFHGICIKCGACIKGCPTGARYFDDLNYLKHQHELEDELSGRKKAVFFI